MANPIRVQEWDFRYIEDAVEITFKDGKGEPVVIAIHQMSFANFETLTRNAGTYLKRRPRAKTLPSAWVRGG